MIIPKESYSKAYQHLVMHSIHTVESAGTVNRMNISIYVHRDMCLKFTARRTQCPSFKSTIIQIHRGGKSRESVPLGKQNEILQIVLQRRRPAVQPVWISARDRVQFGDCSGNRLSFASWRFAWPASRPLLHASHPLHLVSTNTVKSHRAGPHSENLTRSV
jgi:hypothetical protein